MFVSESLHEEIDSILHRGKLFRSSLTTRRMPKIVRTVMLFFNSKKWKAICTYRSQLNQTAFAAHTILIHFKLKRIVIVLFILIPN